MSIVDTAYLQWQEWAVSIAKYKINSSTADLAVPVAPTRYTIRMEHYLFKFMTKHQACNEVDIFLYMYTVHIHKTFWHILYELILMRIDLWLDYHQRCLICFSQPEKIHSSTHNPHPWHCKHTTYLSWAKIILIPL